MYEIKKIVPFSIAKYVALILLILRFLFYIFSILSDFVSSPEYFRTSFTSDIAKKWFMNVTIDLILIYIFSFVITYFFAFIYNRIVRKSKMRGIMLEFNLVDDSILKEKSTVAEALVDKEDDKFVV